MQAETEAQKDEEEIADRDSPKPEESKPSEEPAVRSGLGRGIPGLFDY